MTRPLVHPRRAFLLALPALALATTFLCASLLFPSALLAQEHSHSAAEAPSRDVKAVEPAPAPLAGTNRLDESDRLFDSIRSAVESRDISAVKSSTEAYVANLLALREEIGPAGRPEEPERNDLLAVVGKRVASQAPRLDALAADAPRRLRKLVQHAVASADALLAGIARGRGPEERIRPKRRDAASHHSSGSSCGH